MEISKKEFNIVRLRVTDSLGNTKEFETFIPAVKTDGQVTSIEVTGVSRDIRFSGDWAYESVTREMWDETT